MECGYRVQDDVDPDIEPRARSSSHINKTCSPGQRIGILGANGQGKSTLVKTIAGALPALGGDGHRRQGPVDRLLRAAGDGRRCTPTTRRCSTWCGSPRRSAPKAASRSCATSSASSASSATWCTSTIGTLSGGEKARLVLASLVWQRPNLLLLDEPTNHLDLTTREALSMALNEFEGTVMLVSHDRALLREVCDEFWLVVARRGAAVRRRPRRLPEVAARDLARARAARRCRCRRCRPCSRAQPAAAPAAKPAAPVARPRPRRGNAGAAATTARPRRRRACRSPERTRPLRFEIKQIDKRMARLARRRPRSRRCSRRKTSTPPPTPSTAEISRTFRPRRRGSKSAGSSCTANSKRSRPAEGHAAALSTSGAVGYSRLNTVMQAASRIGPNPVGERALVAGRRPQQPCRLQRRGLFGQRLLHRPHPRCRRVLRHPRAAAAAVVRDRQIAQQRTGEQRVEHASIPAHLGLRHAAYHVDAARRAGCSERADDAAGEQAAAERQAAAGDVGLQSRERTGDDAAPYRGAAFIDRRADRVVARQLGQHLLAGAAVQTVQLDQHIGGTLDVVVQAFGQLRHRTPLRRIRGGVVVAQPQRTAQARADAAHRAAPAVGLHRLHVERGAPQAVGELGHRFAPAFELALAPRRAAGARTRRAAPSASSGATAAQSTSSCTQQRAKASSGSTRVHATCAAQLLAPARSRAASSSRGRGGPSWFSSTSTGLPIQPRTCSSASR